MYASCQAVDAAGTYMFADEIYKVVLLFGATIGGLWSVFLLLCLVRRARKILLCGVNDLLWHNLMFLYSFYYAYPLLVLSRVVDFE